MGGRSWIALAVVALALWAVGEAAFSGGQDDLSGESMAPIAVPQDAVPEDAIQSDLGDAVPEDAIQPDPVTGAPIPAVGTKAREDMERKEVECFDSGRTDCADTPGAYLDDPQSYP